jgi:hypothetical protein
VIQRLAKWWRGCGVVPGSTAGDPGTAYDPAGAFRDNGANQTNAAFLQGNASITQTITGFVIGTTYQLDFDYNARMDGNCCGTAGGHIPNFTVSLSDTDGSRTWSYDDSAATAVDANGSYVNPWYHGRITFRPGQDTLVLVVASDTMGLDGTTGPLPVRLSALMHRSPRALGARRFPASWPR